MTDTPRSAPDPAGTPDPLGKSAPDTVAPTSGPAAETQTSDFPGGIVTPGSPHQGTTAPDTTSGTVPDAPGRAGQPPMTSPDPAAPGPSGASGPEYDPTTGQPVYGPPGTGPAPTSPVYGYQAVGSGIPGRLDVGHALSYGLEKFRRNSGPWLAVTSLGLIIYLALTVLVQIAEPRAPLSLLLLFAAVMGGLWLLQAALVRGALYETDGYRPGFGSYFYLRNVGSAFLTALLAFLATALASAFCLLPGIAVGIGCMFALHFAIEQGHTPVEAIKASVQLVLRDPVRVLLLVLTVLVVTALGLLACGVGLLVAGPVSVMAVTYAYRTLTGGPISAA